MALHKAKRDKANDKPLHLPVSAIKAPGVFFKVFMDEAVA